MNGPSDLISENNNKDVSMVDVSKVAQENGQQQQVPDGGDGITNPPRRRSTLLLTEDIDLDRMNIDQKEGTDTDGIEDDMNIDDGNILRQQQQQPDSQQQVQQQQQQQHPPKQQAQPGEDQKFQPDPNLTVPVDIKWVQGGEKVYVTGSFTGWRKMIGLVRQPDNSFLITLGLPVGTHRFRFVVDNELRFSDFLPTATDQMGNFVNYIEITPENIEQHLLQLETEQAAVEEDQTQEPPISPQNERATSRKSSMSKHRTDSMWGLINDDDDMGNGYSRYHDEDGTSLRREYQYINEIPPIFTDPKVMEQYYVAIDKQARNSGGGQQQQAWLHPPQLPPHLENVILNNFNDRENNSGALPIPNHVVLNHLATTSIKHNTLAVASIVRYKRKYVTQVLYSPLQPTPES